ncbi:MAG: hypothetical protein Aurels2KO_41200 [Aureliella sp.]
MQFIHRLALCPSLRALLLATVVLPLLVASAHAQLSPETIARLSAVDVISSAMEKGRAARGAVLFHGPSLACGRCHSVKATGPELLGPNLTKPLSKSGTDHIWQSLANPSAHVDEKYRATQVLTADGDVVTGMLTDQSADQLRLKLPSTMQEVTIAADDIEQVRVLKTSLMPEGLLQSLANERELLDLVRYLLEIQSGGAERARELQPTAAQLAIQLPDYEASIDHAGMIADLDDGAFERGEKIYTGLCVNCHGTREKPGSLATALRFGEGKFKHGADPYSMYQTLTRGAGLMLPQPWMVPEQKYDVVHYIREHFLSEDSSGLPEIDADYLAGLPKGTERGPQPQEITPWSQADYGPRLVGTYEIGRGARNIAQKGIAVQLDASPGGIAQGGAWAIFDHDTMRLAAVWSSGDFIDWQGINFNGRHGIHPHISGDLLLSNPTGPGWAKPSEGKLIDDERVVGRDGRRYGPLPRSWAQYRGLHQNGRRTTIDYTVGEVSISEHFAWKQAADVPTGVDTTAQASAPVFSRHMQIGPHKTPLQLVAATLDDAQQWETIGATASSVSAAAAGRPANEFGGDTYYEAELPQDWNSISADFTVLVEASINSDGTLVALAPADGPWAAGGQTLFVRGGRLAYDVGWVGEVTAPGKIADGKKHRIALVFSAARGSATLWVDGEEVATKRLRPKEKLENAVLRVGRTSENFPKTSTLEDGEIDSIAIYDRQLSNDELRSRGQPTGVVAVWNLGEELSSDAIESGDASALSIELRRKGSQSETTTPIRLRALGREGLEFVARGPQLLLNLPASDVATQVVVWTTRADNSSDDSAIDSLVQMPAPTPTERADLFPEVLTTKMPESIDSGEGFAVDVLAIPKQNPWLARVRLTGLDFYDGGDRMAVCTWDGDVWEVSGLSSCDVSRTLNWRRVAFGLFQPLGLKIIDGEIYLTCRDQLVRLQDTTGDGTIDYYHCVNSDHQVTEHFHEFAMGLQTDAAGNFYYAKSARHALPAIVPHHGTLLRVSPDGETTEIIANGFRAANGVCLNPDGSFIVTDQEGHWNPKNRINWVRNGGFYGNMYGYHDVTDSSDSAMEQPLCWITNAFDRSPAELLWCESPKWGPLSGTLLNLSYGYGKVYVVPHEQTNGGVQGGMCALPIEDFPTGVIRGRFSPHDNQLYLCGLSAWASSQTAEKGGLYRIRYTGEPAALPLGLSVMQGRVEIKLSEPASSETSLDPSQFAVRTWDLKRTKNYGSKHYNEKSLKIQRVELSGDGQTLTLYVPDVQPTWSMEIQYAVRSPSGKTLQRVIHNTIHEVR